MSYDIIFSETNSERQSLLKQKLATPRNDARYGRVRMSRFAFAQVSVGVLSATTPTIGLNMVSDPKEKVLNRR